MSDIKAPARPAIFAKIEDKYIWKCAVASCKGRLATAKSVDDLECDEWDKENIAKESGRSWLVLPQGFVRRSDGVFSLTMRSAARSDEVKEIVKISKEFEVLGSNHPAILESLSRAKAEKHSRVYLYRSGQTVIKRTQLPIVVQCPGCKSLCIISSVKGVAR